MISPTSPKRQHDAVFKTSPGKSWLMRDYEARCSMLRNAVQKTGKTLETPRKTTGPHTNQGTPKMAMQAAMLHLTDALSGQDVCAHKENGKSIDENMDDCVKKLQEALAVLRAPLTPRTCSPLGRRTPLSRKQASTPMSRCNLHSLLERVSASPQSPNQIHSPIRYGNHATRSPLGNTLSRVNKRLDLSPALEKSPTSPLLSQKNSRANNTSSPSTLQIRLLPKLSPHNDENVDVEADKLVCESSKGRTSVEERVTKTPSSISKSEPSKAINKIQDVSNLQTVQTSAVNDAPVVNAPNDASVVNAPNDGAVVKAPNDAPVVVAPNDAPVVNAPTVAPIKEEMPAKYANMVKMGVPLAAVRIKMMADGICVVPVQEGPSQVTRRQRLAWQAVDGGRRRNSIWHHDSPLSSPTAEDEPMNMVVLSPDALDDFEKHWTKREEVPKKKKTVSKKPKEVCVIDSKRSMNASIALARIMRAQGGVSVAHAVYCLREDSFTLENLVSMLEYAPTKLEAGKLQHFINTKMKGNSDIRKSPSKKKKAVMNFSTNGGGMANVFAQLKEKKNDEATNGGGMANVFAQLKEKKNDEATNGGGMANVFAQLKEKKNDEATNGGGMANVFAQLKEKKNGEATNGGGMANVFAQLKNTKQSSFRSAHGGMDENKSGLNLGDVCNIAPYLESLSEGEKFMCFVMLVPDYEQRVKAITFKQAFSDRVSMVKEGTRTLTGACAAIKRSEKLKKLLKAVLQLGNKVNEAEGRESEAATAITVESLLALSTIKSFKDKKTTMLQYVVAFLKQSKPDLLDFFLDFEDVVLCASRVDLKCLSIEVNALRSEASLAEEFRHEKPSSELFDPSALAAFDTHHQSLGCFLNEASATIKRAQGEVDIAQAQFKALLDYFLEPDPNMDSQRFFATLLKFTKEFKDAKAAVEKTQQQKAAQNRRLSLKRPK